MPIVILADAAICCICAWLYASGYADLADVITVIMPPLAVTVFGTWYARRHPWDPAKTSDGTVRTAKAAQDRTAAHEASKQILKMTCTVNDAPVLDIEVLQDHMSRNGLRLNCTHPAEPNSASEQPD